MSTKIKDNDFEPDFYAGTFGCLFGAFLLPVFTLWLCSVAAPQISYLDKENWVKALACVNGAFLGGSAGSALARLKNDAYEAGSTVYKAGYVMFTINTFPWFQSYLNGQSQAKLESLSLQSWIVAYSLIALWIITLIIWGAALMRKNKPDKSD